MGVTARVFQSRRSYAPVGFPGRGDPSIKATRMGWSKWRLCTIWGCCPRRLGAILVWRRWGSARCVMLRPLYSSSNPNTMAPRLTTGFPQRRRALLACPRGGLDLACIVTAGGGGWGMLLWRGRLRRRCRGWGSLRRRCVAGWFGVGP